MSSSRPGSSSSRANNANGGGNIERREYKPGGRPLLHDDGNDSSEPASRNSDEHSLAGSFFSDVAEGIQEQDRATMSKEVIRYVSFFWALINTLGAGGITAYSLYGPMFLKRLHYSQYQVNGVSIAAEMALYLPVPIWGYMCDRFGPRYPSLISGFIFAIGYMIAAFAYKSGPPVNAGGDGWPYWSMIVAFLFVGSGTSSMYISAVSTCAKNFGRGKYKGVALALPIACFGLAGMWQSLVGSQLLYEPKSDGSKGDVDVYRYFIFLACFLLAAGVGGFFTLQVVDEEELIDEAVDELEQSGLLESRPLFTRMTTSGTLATFGTFPDGSERRLNSEEADVVRQKADEEEARRLEEQAKKTWLLNEETRRFLTDSTMWWLAAGFFLATGPGEAFINNLGTIIGTLYPPSISTRDDSGMTTAATHVSIVCLASTLARLLSGTVTDLVAPTAPLHQHRRGPNSLSNSLASLPPSAMASGRFEVSRIVILVICMLVMSIGFVALASGALQGHGGLFWISSATIGFGYGAAFSLAPICTSVIWGVENFGTNWGVINTVPAIGNLLWSLIYSANYQWAARRDTRVVGALEEDVLCYGAMCYAPSFAAMTISVWLACGCWMWAYRGPGGWYRKGVLV